MDRVDSVDNAKVFVDLTARQWKRKKKKNLLYGAENANEHRDVKRALGIRAVSGQQN